jgi:hypothetical protein
VMLACALAKRLDREGRSVYKKLRISPHKPCFFSADLVSPTTCLGAIFL